MRPLVVKVSELPMRLSGIHPHVFRRRAPGLRRNTVSELHDYVESITVGEHIRAVTPMSVSCPVERTPHVLNQGLRVFGWYRGEHGG